MQLPILGFIFSHNWELDLAGLQMCTKKSPVYYWNDEDGFYCSVDGQPEYFRTRSELYAYACDTERDLIEVTDENESELRAAGAFVNQGDL